ncbi:DUF11 domain-containing protein [Conexibacter sp. W3-3-2]|uniref:DUF6923 family protein n=1 Tax=Conexibacter sp. W3-3-2 TaxID=2675227 RepID=UPI0012B91A65|nr:Ig-like domain-containing protein [Conexibacter sp. W3-3-2]MTD42743.1 DUF11 domain-containing protein [Conexibacter sp. W3-3-2]
MIAIDQVGTLSGEGEPGATVTVLDQDASPIATTPVQDDGTWQVEGPFACGTTVSATQTDAAGNASPASTPGVPACNDGSGPKRCTPGQIIVSGNSPADLLRVVADTGGYRTSAIDASGSVTYNGIGYNAADGLVYAVAENGHLLKLGVQDAATTDLGAVSNLPAGTYAAGAFGPDGAYYVKPLDGTTMYRIDVANRLATEVGLSAPAKVSDFALIAGRLWGKHNDQATIMRIDPTTGQVDAFPATGVVPGGLVQAAGGAWKFGNGDLGLVFNSSSEIRQVRIAGADTATPTFSLVSVGRTEAVNGNVDGTYCEGAETDLAIAKTGRVTAMTGADSTLAWEITVSNRGTTASSGAVVTDQLPAPVTDVATATEGCTVDGRTVRCLVGSLAPGATASIAVTGRVVGTLGRVDNTARVEGQDADPTSTNDTATASLAPPPTAPAVDLPQRHDAAAGRQPSAELQLRWRRRPGDVRGDGHPPGRDRRPDRQRGAAPDGRPRDVRGDGHRRRRARPEHDDDHELRGGRAEPPGRRCAGGRARRRTRRDPPGQLHVLRGRPVDGLHGGRDEARRDHRPGGVGCPAADRPARRAHDHGDHDERPRADDDVDVHVPRAADLRAADARLR